MYMFIYIYILYQVSDNAFGAFIHVGLQAGVVSALVNCGPMVLVSLLIQVSGFRVLILPVPLRQSYAWQAHAQTQ